MHLYQACWSADGAHIFAGRRNGTIDVWDMRKYGPGSGHGQPKPFKTLRNPSSSGSVVCVTAFPDRQHLVWYVYLLRLLRCEIYWSNTALTMMHSASQDNLRLWNVGMEEPDSNMAKGRQSQSAPFKIIAGHHGLISQIRKFYFISVWIDWCSILTYFPIPVVDPSSKFMITASGNRGWWGDSTRAVIVHSIVPQ